MPIAGIQSMNWTHGQTSPKKMRADPDVSQIKSARNSILHKKEEGKTHQPNFLHPLSPFFISHNFIMAGGRSPITCHVLDSSCGKPGNNVPVKLEMLNPAANNAWVSVAYG